MIAYEKEKKKKNLINEMKIIKIIQTIRYLT